MKRITKWSSGKGEKGRSIDLMGLLVWLFLYGFLHWYWKANLWELPIYHITFSGRQTEVPVAVTILHFFSRLLLLLVFGSRPSDQTEGTFVGIGDATNMAVIPQGLNEYTWKCSINHFDITQHGNPFSTSQRFHQWFDWISKFLPHFSKV